MQFPFTRRLPLQSQRMLLGKYFAPQRRRIGVLAALILADIALRLVNPQIVRIFIDTAEAGGPLAKLTTAAVLFIVAGLLGRAIGLGSTYAGLNLGWAATNRLRSDLASHLLRLDMPFHKTHTPGELIERVDGDVTTLADFFADMVVKVAGNALLVAAILGLLYREDATIGAILTVYTVVVIAALGLVGRIGVQAWTAAREAWASQMGYLEERLSGTEDIRGIGAEAHAEARFGRLALNLLYKARAGWLANALGSAITNFLFIAGYGLGLAIGAILYLQGQVSIGTAFLIVSYIGMLATPLEEIRGQAERLQEATAGVNRVSEILALEPEVQDLGTLALPFGPLQVDFERVDFRYADKGEGSDNPAGEDPAPRQEAAGLVLRNVSFSLAAGRVLGVLGRTGSGKTTLTRLLFRLYDPEAGAIRLDRTDIRDVSFDALRGAVGLVTQDVQLFGASVGDNITLFDGSVPDAEIERSLAALGILDWVRAMPQGVATKLAPGGGGMSAGEAQLLAFARILLRNPGLVVLDEAASRLDPVTERRLERAIDTLLGGNGGRRTAIVIAHRLHTVQRADDILILERGQVVEFGPREALAADPDSRFSGLLRTGLEEALA
jgi:ATP-binding cassette, subfamily B, bacterial